MSMKNVFSPSVATLCVASLFIASVPVAAQSESRPGRQQNPAKAQVLNLHRQAAETAKLQALSGNVAEAEKALDQLSNAAKNSAARQLATAQRLTELANTLMRAGEPRAAQSAASRALAILVAAEALPANVSLQSAIQSQKGILQERFLGDEAAALTAFQSAAELEPDNAAAKEKLKRVKDAESSLRGKLNVRP